MILICIKGRYKTSQTQTLLRELNDYHKTFNITNYRVTASFDKGHGFQYVSVICFKYHWIESFSYGFSYN